MDRNAANHFIKTASLAEIDALTRARFLEGMAGVAEGRVVRNQPATVLVNSVIPELVWSILTDGHEAGGTTPEAGAVSPLWTGTGSSRLYANLVDTLGRIFDEDTAMETMSRALFSSGETPSPVWEAGKLTSRNRSMVRRFAEGAYAPLDAFKVILSLVRRDALDLVRVQRRREELEGGNETTIRENLITGFAPEEWESVLERMGESNSPTAREFWKWVTSQAELHAPPAVVAYFEQLAEGATPRGDEIARQFDVSEAYVSKAKTRFLTHLSDILGSDDSADHPEVMNLLSDAHFLSLLESGRVRGDRVARNKEAGPGQGLGFRVAYSLATLVSKNDVGAVGTEEWKDLCADIADAFRKASALPVDHQAEFAEAVRAWWKPGAYGR